MPPVFGKEVFKMQFLSNSKGIFQANKVKHGLKKLSSPLKTALLTLTLFMPLTIQAKATALYWFCSAAAKNPSLEIAKLFNKTHKDKVFLIAGGTGQVLEQMRLSKRGDVYTCLDEKFFTMAKNMGLVLKYKKILKMTPVFGLSKRGESKIKSFKDLFKRGIKIAGGNPKTMALGKTYIFLEKRLPKTLSEKLRKNTTVYAINISQIINYLKLSVVDAGILFKSVARMNKLKFIKIPEKYNQIKTGYLAEISYGKSKTKEKLFKFILKHLDIYRKWGFTVIYP